MYSLDPSPYGTPISLSLIDCPNQIPFSSTNQDGIPDSPRGKAFLQSIIDLNDDDTKSESPDLGQNLFDVPLSQAGTPAAGTELSITEAAHDAVPQAANTEALYGKATSQTDLVSVAASAVTDAGCVVPLSQGISGPTQPARLRPPLPQTVAEETAEGLSKPKQRLGGSLPRNTHRSVSNSRKEPYDVFDIIETDMEDSQNKHDRPSSGWDKLRSKERTQLPPFSHARKSATNGDVRPPSLGTKKDAQQERLERKRKREDAKSLGNKDVELERMTEPPEELDSTLQAKEAEDKERQSRADETKEKEKKNDSPEKQKDNIVHGKGQNRVLKANQAEEQDRIAERKADKTQFKEQKTRVPERDIKRLETEQNPKPDGRQDVAKQANGRTMSTRTPGRSGSENVMDRRAEPAVQKAQEPSEPGRPKSSTPLSSSKSEEAKKKSLTAFYPTSGGSRSSSLSIELSSPIQETPLKGTKTGKQPPLTSALGKSANTLCRSGSSVSWADPIAPSNFSLPAKPAATAPNSNGDKHTSSSPITSADVVASLVRQPSAEIIRSSSASSVGIVPKKSRYPPKKTSANTKKQTKLNVKRDVKQKGRVIDPPSPSKPVVEEALVISSDSDDIVSEFYSEPDDDVQEMSHAKAGPSSKKKTKSDTKIAAAKAVITPPDFQYKAAKQATVVRATPSIEKPTNSQHANVVTTAKTLPNSHDKAANQATVEHATPTVEKPTSSQQARVVTTAKTLPNSQDITATQAPVKNASPTNAGAPSSQQSATIDTLPKASSRSPARYISSTPSSASSSSTKSDASAGSPSPPDIAPEPSSQTLPEMRSTSVDSTKSSSKSLEPNGVKSTPAAGRRLSSQSSTSATQSTQQTQSSDTVSVESALNQQLQREARQFSEPAHAQVKSTPPVTRDQASKSNLETEATPVATPSEYPYTMSGPRPANFRFPSLTKLKNNPPKYDPKERLKHASFLSSQILNDPRPVASSQTNGVTHDDESSSESDDDSASSSDNENDNDKAPSSHNPFSSPVESQLSKKSDGRNAKGLSSLVKRKFFTSK